MEEIEYYVKKLNLKPLWTIDFLDEFYNSDLILKKENLPAAFKGDRHIFNWAYYLIPEGCICPFHIMYAEESWQYCAGGPLDIITIEEQDKVSKVTIGNNLEEDHRFVHIVPRNKWFAATPRPGSKFTLITHCVSPGFELEDEERGYIERIQPLIPSHQDLIKKFSWPR